MRRIAKATKILVYIVAIFIAYSTNIFAKNLCDIKIQEKEQKIIIKLVCAPSTSKPKILPQGSATAFRIIIPNSTVKYDYSSLPNSIKKIDLHKNGHDTELAIFLKDQYTPSIKEQNEKVIIAFQKGSKNFSYKLPEMPKEIYTPFKKPKYTGAKISIDIQNADIKSVLRMLSEVGNVNIVLGEEIEGKITLKVRNVPWDQVLDIIMARFGLGKVELNGIIFIAPLSTLQKRAEELKKVKEALAEEEKTGPLKTKYITLNYINACDLIKEQQQNKKGVSIVDVLSEKGKATCDSRTNTLIIKDTEDHIEEIENIISKLDIPSKQVLIEARIVEISSKFAKNLGIQWFGGYYKTNDKTNFKISPSTTFPVGKGGQPLSGIYDETGGPGWSSFDGERWTAPLPFGPIVDLSVPASSKLGFAIGHITKTSALLLDLQLSALEEEGQGKIVSAPRIITRDNGEAVIKQGYQIPYLELTEQGTATTKFVDADLTLKVTPHILPNNEIRLVINIDKSEPDWTKAIVLHGYSVPAILKRSAQTFVRVPNGGTVVIGGLKVAKKQETYGKVPGLSKLPAVGNLFKNSQKSQEEQELLIFITSKVITSAVEEIDY